MAWSPRDWPTEMPPRDTSRAEVWCYTDRWSYRAGEEVLLHVNATRGAFDLTVVRDGSQPVTVVEERDIPAAFVDTPAESYAVGCGWPVAHQLTVDASWPTGLYLVVVACDTDDGARWEREHAFVVRPAPGTVTNPLALVLTTGTLGAYNDWGGANLYRGLGDDDPRVDIASPVVSTQRPIGRGFLRKPSSAPRESQLGQPPIGWEPRYPAYEWARFHGYSRHHADSFWATYELPFVMWMETQGYAFDYLTQHDLDDDPTSLDGYRCAFTVGHDEYWSWRMRDTVDAFVEGGGTFARFGGNMGSQIRLEDGGTTQVCYRIPEDDPVFGTAEEHLVTAMWSTPVIGRPAQTTFGLTATGYARYGATTPRSSGGYTIYRPHHWVFEGTDLYYGDVLGAVPVGIATFEVDGVDYTFHRGLPYPTFTDGAPESLEILGMIPSVLGEEDRWGVPLGGGVPVDPATGLPEMDLDAWLGGRGLGVETARSPYDWQYAAGMMATFTSGDGEVFNAGTCEWVLGLMTADPFVERITHNIFDRFAPGARASG